MSRFEQLLQETIEDGSLAGQLRRHHFRWRHLWDYDEFSQTVLTRAWEKKDGFAGETAKEFLAWLRKVAWSVAIDCWRRERRNRTFLRRWTQEFARFFAIGEEPVDIQDQVTWLLAGLTERERQLMILKYYKHMSTSEVARVMKITQGAVVQTHFRAIRKLRQQMEKTETPA
jgi:RNA polymerase sigma factor (sigma-70 family)